MTSAITTNSVFLEYGSLVEEYQTSNKVVQSPQGLLHIYWLLPRKQQLHPNMIEKLLAGMLNPNHYENMPMQYTEIFKVVKN